MSKLYPTNSAAFKKRPAHSSYDASLRNPSPIDPRRNPYTGQVAPVRIDDEVNDEKPQHYNTDL